MEVEEGVLVVGVPVLVCEVLEVDEAPVAEEVVLCDEEVVLEPEEVVLPLVAEEAEELLVVFTAVGGQQAVWGGNRNATVRAEPGDDGRDGAEVLAAAGARREGARLDGAWKPGGSAQAGEVRPAKKK